MCICSVSDMWKQLITEKKNFKELCHLYVSNYYSWSAGGARCNCHSSVGSFLIMLHVLLC